MKVSVPPWMTYPEDEIRLPWLSLLTAIQDFTDHVVFIMFLFDGITQGRKEQLHACHGSEYLFCSCSTLAERMPLFDSLERKDPRECLNV